MTLQWRDQLRVGNDVIDNDHKHLIDIINKAEASLHEKNYDKLTEVFEELKSYGNDHFLREELTAKKVGYPNTAHMHDSHIKLLLQIHKIKVEIGSTWTDAASSHFTTLLRDWLIEHVIKEDLLMKPWMEAYPPSYNPSDYHPLEPKLGQEEMQAADKNAT